MIYLVVLFCVLIKRPEVRQKSEFDNQGVWISSVSVSEAIRPPGNKTAVPTFYVAAGTQTGEILILDTGAGEHQLKLLLRIKTTAQGLITWVNWHLTNYVAFAATSGVLGVYRWKKGEGAQQASFFPANGAFLGS